MLAKRPVRNRLVIFIRFLLAGALIAVSLSVFALENTSVGEVADAMSNVKTDVFAAINVDIPKARLQAPAFLLNNLEGGQTALSDFSGKLILLNFWATWCKPCRDEMPAMQRLWEKYRDRGLVVIAISADKKPRAVKTYIEKHSLSFPVLLDASGYIRTKYEVIVLPMSYLIAADGKLSGRLTGVRAWDSQQAFDLIEELLLIE